MSDSTTAEPSINPATLRTGINTPAQAVTRQFSGLPSLEPVIRQLLNDAIGERYPSLAVDVSTLQLATPNGKQWFFRPLMSVVQDYLGDGSELNFSDIGNLDFYLTDSPPRRLKLPGTTAPRLDMKVIEDLIKELADTLPIGLQNALSDYWRDDSTGDRWRWLSDVLMDTLRIAALRRTDLDEPARQTLDQFITTPDREQRNARYGAQAVFAYCLETTLRSATRSVTVLGPELVLTRPTNGTATVLLCRPGGQIEHFASMDALTQAWGQRLSAGYTVEEVLIRRYEPDTNAFDHQAAMILNQQLDNLATLPLPATQGFAALQTHYRQIIDPALYFLDSPTLSPSVLTALSDQLPTWLREANNTAKADYRRFSLALASAKKRAGGRSFLSGIKDIKSFTTDSLRDELQRDAERFRDPTQAGASTPTPDQLLLTFSVAAGYPGTAGTVWHEHMDLTDLAIRNLCSRPRGQLSITHRQGLALPAWLTPDYLTGSGGLIERVDIGGHYPRLLESQLLGTGAEVPSRVVLFADQLSVQLPLLALELSLQHASGMTRTGARRVATLMGADPAEQPGVVIRHLALLRHPGAYADVVTNMYIIEAQDIADGPHILYRPLYSEPLREFRSRAALFDAIAEPGELQSSVLLWLDDNARPIYANNGFREPHYLRFGQGDEFSPVSTPEPATLSADGINDELHQCLITGRLMQYLYSGNARALVSQADRESVSNSESRWQALLEGGGLLFGSVLYPLLRGPTLFIAWLAGLYARLKQDIQGLESTDPSIREQAGVDLLLNLGLTLLEGAPLPSSPSIAAGAERRDAVLPLPPHVAERWPIPAAPHIHQGAVTLPGVLPGTDKAVLDFSFAQARHRLTSSQRTRLGNYKAPRPKVLPQPILNGPRKGLYVVDNAWYAEVDGEWFRVDLEGGSDGVTIVEAFDTERRGPHLRTDGLGTWILDTRLRLRGGMPPKRIAEQRQRKAQRIAQLDADYAQFMAQEATQRTTAEVAQGVMEKAKQDPRFTEAQRAATRRRCETALEQQSLSYQKILDSVKERQELATALSTQTVAILLENSINNARKLVVIAEDDRQALYRANSKFTVKGPEFELAMLLEPEIHDQFIKDLVEINERSIRWLQTKDRHLNELLGQGTPGAQGFARLTKDRPEEISALAVQGQQIQTFKFLALKEDASFATLDAVLSPLPKHIRTHRELDTLDLTPSDRMSVLDSLVEHYGRVLDGLQGMGIADAQALDKQYSTRLFKLIEALYQDVTLKLANEIKPIEQPLERLPKRPPTAPGKPPKKVIKTRRKGTFIGDLKAAESASSIDVVEVRSEENNQLLGTYSQRGDEWDEIRVAVAPPPASAPRGLSLVKGEARKVLAMLDEHLRRGDDYRKISRHPDEVQEFMHHKSKRYDTLAAELDQAIQALPPKDRNAADQALVTHLLAAGTRLRTQGDAWLMQLCLELPPTHGNLQHLINQKQVNVARYDQRVQLSGERRDFIQEYAVTDMQANVLWYAHFHYASAETPKADYAVAHLKTKEQRKQSYYSLLAKANNPQAVVNVHHGLIGRNLAERWFLPLAP